MNISIKQAEAAIKAAKEEAVELDTLMNIAIVDAGANLVAFARMDDAWMGSIDIALRKAKTARYFNMETGEIGKLSQPGGQAWQIEHSNGGLITFPGGVPIKNNQGEIIGAIGASGSTADNDHRVAQAGADALLRSADGGSSLEPGSSKRYQMPPREGISIAHFLTVANIERSARYYEKVFGGRILSNGDSDGAPAYIQIENTWLLVNVGGGPTPDKPTVTLSVPNPDKINSFMNIRVADIHACYQLWKSRGAEFITEPIPKYGEIRCYIRDPDGYIIEVGQSTELTYG